METQELYSSAKKIGALLADELKNNPNFYFFSPDETTSNKFDEIYKVAERAWDLKTESWDFPQSNRGHIVEMLSENVLFSVMTGHLMSGGTAMLGSYEAFLPIITAQLLQHMKFIKQSSSVKWRTPLPAVNLLSTSTCWRQEHNGYTHQSPALISLLLSVPSNLANCFFPIDDLSATTTFKWMLDSHNAVNITTFNKNELPRHREVSNQKDLILDGAVVVEEWSEPNPDFVIAAAGDIMADEAIEAVRILKSDLPNIKLRFVYINTLSYRGIGINQHKLTIEQFNQIFTKDKPILANFHGYPETLENILENYALRNRLRVHGYSEEGSTTTPMEMLRRNAASRYDLAIDVAIATQRDDLAEKYRQILRDNQKYAESHGLDMIK